MVRSIFQKGITFGVGPLGSFLYSGFAKIGCKNLQNFVSELGFKLGVMRGFQKSKTVGGRASGSLHILGLQKWVAKDLQNFCI